MCDVVCVAPHIYEPPMSVCLCVGMFPVLCMMSCPSLLSPPVLAELQLADLISCEKGRGLSDSKDLVRMQSSKSSEVMVKTAEVLRMMGFEEEYKFLLGKQTRPSSGTLCGSCSSQLCVSCMSRRILLYTVVAVSLFEV